MSPTIDKRVVEMGFDNAQFESGVQQTVKSLDSLKKGLDLKESAKGFNSVSDAAKNFNLQTVTNSVQDLTSRFSAFGVMGLTVLANLTNSAVNFAKKMANEYIIGPLKMGLQEYETQMNAIQTVLANTQSKGTNLKQVNAALDVLNAYSDKTIYNFTEMTKNIGTFTAAGISLETSVSAIKGIANLAAVSGSNSQQASTAMYQLSQALASGTVKLMDWNSVVNAGMGGQVFQDALKETARVHKINIDQMIKQEGSFRETLQKGWLTSDILTETLSKFTGDLNAEQLKSMGYTEKQIEEIIKLGVTANDAATKIKTFSQLKTTMMEAIQSGWGQTFRTIIGDFDEAKSLFTSIGSFLGDIIGKSSDARNNLLNAWKAGPDANDLMSGDLLEDAESLISGTAEGRNDNGFERAIGGRDLLIRALSTAFQSLYSIMQSVGSAFREIFPPITGDQLYKLTLLLDTFAKKLVASSETLDKIKRVFRGVFAVFDIFRMVLIDIGKALFNFVKNIFPPGGFGFLDDLVDFADKLFALRQGIVMFAKDGKALGFAMDWLKYVLKDTFGISLDTDKLMGFFTTVKEGFKTVVEALPEIITKFKDGFKKARESIAAFIKGVVEVFNSLKTFFSTNGVFLAIIAGIKSFINSVGKLFSSIGNVFNSFKKIDTSGLDGFGERVSARFSGLSKLGDFLGPIFDGIGDKIKAAAASMKKAQALVGKIFSSIWKAIVTGFKNIDLSKFDFNGVFDGINAGLLGALLISVMNFVKNGSNIFSSIVDVFKGVKGFADSTRGVLDGVKEVLGGVKSSLEAWQQSLRADMLLKIAIAIAILAVALIALSLIDSKKLTIATGAVTAMFADLFASMALFEKVSGTGGGGAMGKAVLGMLALSVSILILSAALANIARLDPQQILYGMTAITGMVAILVTTSKLLSKDTGSIIRTAIGLSIFAISLLLLGEAVKSIGAVKPDELAQGLKGVGILLAELAIFMKVTDMNKMGLRSAVGLLVLAGAISLLALAVSKFGVMKAGEVIQGLEVVGLILAELAIFTKITNNSQGVISTAIGLVILGGAILIFAEALSRLGKMKWDEIGRGLVAMGGALAIIVVAMRLMPKNMASSALSLMVVAASMIVLGQALTSMGKMSWEEIAKSLVALAGSMTILALGLNAMKGAVAGAAAMILVAVALSIFVPQLQALGSMTLAQIGTGLLALAGAFVVLGIAGYLLAPVAPVIATLAGSMLILGLACTAVGVGLFLFSVALTSLAVSGVAGATAIVAIIGILLSVIPLLIVTIVGAIVLFATLIAQSAPILVGAIITTLLAVVNGIVTVIPQIVAAGLTLIMSLLAALMGELPTIIEAGFAIIMALLNGIKDNIGKIVTVAIDIVTRFIDTVAQKIPDVIQSAFGLIISFIDGLTAAVDENLPKIVESVGKLAGAIISGLVEGLFAGVGEVVSAVMSIGQQAIDAFKGKVESNSPSKVFMELGGYITDGLVKGLNQNGNDVARATGELGDNAVSGMSTAISRISDLLAADLDVNPTIRPVVDMTDITNSGKIIDDTFGSKAIGLNGVSATAASISATQSERAKMQNASATNGASNSSVSFVQNNYSPTALSQFEIYRRTRNQLALMKGLVKN